LQATIMIPYPGTLLYKYCHDNNLLLTQDHNRFDQGEQVMQTELSDAEIKKMIRKFYRSFLTPKFFWSKIKSIRSCADIKFYLKAGLKVLGHLGDFARK